MRERGVEPLSDNAGWILSPVRLPVPPLSHLALGSITLTINYSPRMCQEIKLSKVQKPGLPIGDSTPFFKPSAIFMFSVLKV